MKRQILTIASLGLLLSGNAFALSYKAFYKGIAGGSVDAAGYSSAEFVEATPVQQEINLAIKGPYTQSDGHGHLQIPPEEFNTPWNVKVSITTIKGEKEDYVCTATLPKDDMPFNAAYLLSNIWHDSHMHGRGDVLELYVSKSFNTINLIYFFNDDIPVYSIVVPAKTKDGSIPTCQLS